MWGDSVITNAGKTVLDSWTQGTEFSFDGAKGGTGTVAVASLMAQTALASEKQTLSLVGSEVVTGGIKIQVQIGAASTAYTLNQIGIWGSVDGGTSTLIAIYQDSTGVPIPSSADMPDFIYTFYATIAMSNSGTFTLTIDTSASVSMTALTESLAEKSDLVHTHEILDVEGLQTALDGKQAAGSYAASSHDHDVADVTGLQTALDGKAATALYTATIGTTWTGTEAPFSQVVNVTGILATDAPMVDIVQTGSEATDEVMRENWGKVTRIVTGAGSITVYASEALTGAIPVQIRVVR